MKEIRENGKSTFIDEKESYPQPIEFTTEEKIASLLSRYELTIEEFISFIKSK